MTSYRLTIPFLIMSLLPSVVLLGCQTTEGNQIKPLTVESSALVNDKEMEALIERIYSEPNEHIRSWKLPELPVSTLNRYDWQLIEWLDKTGRIINLDAERPVLMDVRPSNLIFDYDCQRYRVDHSDYNDYKYSPYLVSTLTPPSCLTTPVPSSSHSLSSEQKQQRYKIVENLTALFPRYGRGSFSFQLISQKPSTYQLVLKAQDDTLTFKGSVKTIKPTSGLPITKEFLESHKWRLVSAINSNQQPITELNYRGIPIYSGFYTSNERSNAGFSANCNGVGGPYILTPDHILLIGSGAQSMMGCGPKREAAEDKIREVEQLSRGQLSLKQYPDSDESVAKIPYYLLTQKLDSGDTLIWKNEKKE
ncbi:hypothetical protein ES754_05685 [Psychrobacter frigidicola]|uniref:META domain-containing protein n=1 Tax=Psychrobacter frigidicola TaxID=45611 RepID=A0A5C7A5F5_9GAMM|nr:hypothetical protein [Psychrobacter frigidicola]TXD98408.1 hypothetical protein ES754_05685 [Psychrobacter frigidicola]